MRKMPDTINQENGIRTNFAEVIRLVEDPDLSAAEKEARILRVLDRGVPEFPRVLTGLAAPGVCPVFLVRPVRAHPARPVVLSRAPAPQGGGQPTPSIPPWSLAGSRPPELPAAFVRPLEGGAGRSAAEAKCFSPCLPVLKTILKRIMPRPEKRFILELADKTPVR